MVKVRELLKIEIGNLREIWEKKIKELEEKIINIEKELEEQRTERRRREEEKGEWDLTGERRIVLRRVEWIRSASRASSWRSEGGDSEAFGDVEVKRIWKLVPRNRREKKDNIIIKGLKTEERVSNVWGKGLLKKIWICQ